MNVALRKPTTREEFFDWAEVQDGRYEFDGFQPVAMTGGNLGHSRLIRNINRQLGNRLEGKSCEPLGSDAGVATVGGTVRYPDAVVTGAKFSDWDRVVPDAIIVFEVVSPSSRANASAIARPIPFCAPVISATLFARSISDSRSFQTVRTRSPRRRMKWTP